MGGGVEPGGAAQPPPIRAPVNAGERRHWRQGDTCCVVLLCLCLVWRCVEVHPCVCLVLLLFLWVSFSVRPFQVEA